MMRCAEQAGDLVEDHEPRGIADGDDQRVVLLLDGHEVVAEHQLDRHGAQQVVLNLEVLQVDELGVIARGQRLRPGRARPRTGGKRNRKDGGLSHGLPLTSARLCPAKRWAGRAR